jgi:hypothetical protein
MEQLVLQQRFVAQTGRLVQHQSVLQAGSSSLEQITVPAKHASLQMRAMMSCAAPMTLLNAVRPL